jgi:glycerate 2-kinase
LEKTFSEQNKIGTMPSLPENYEQDLTFLRQSAQDIFTHALEACSVENAFTRKVRSTGSLLHIEEASYDLRDYDRVRIVAAGKAAAAMLASLLQRLPLLKGCDCSGILAAPSAPDHLPAGIAHFAGGHPLPNAASLQAGCAARAMLAALPRDAESARRTLCIFLISGGASAMLEEPLDAAMTLEDVQQFHQMLVRCGAPIAEINCVRKHFSAVKGGRLAMAAPPGATLMALLVSDVPAHALAELGSGPVMPDPTTLAQCRAVIGHYALDAVFPKRVRQFFEQNHLAETPKPGAFPIHACTLLDGEDLLSAARKRAEALGFRTSKDTSCDEWEYKAVARHLLERLRDLRMPAQQTSEAAVMQQVESPRFVCLLSAGELSVAVPEPCGVGGRNQQWALYAATEMKAEDAPIVVLSAGTDGLDGNSPAAGALADSDTLRRAEEYGLDVERALQTFDAYPLLKALDSAVLTGATGNNLRDLRILLTKVQPIVPIAQKQFRLSSRLRRSHR